MIRNYNQRRQGALTRLLRQLQTGTKLSAEGIVPLTEEDRARIKGEIAVLRTRVPQ